MCQTMDRIGVATRQEETVILNTNPVYKVHINYP